ncbi:MAG: hypothetical protein M1814_002882 [Vezdaea aestivalis]|nr:MAG: hypothetical protein M1814_002882 [Vezdaea aestivalis]
MSSLGAEKDANHWGIYDARAEWRRQGVSEKSVDRGWRISNINLDYKFSPTYPSLLVVPTSVSDNVINYAGKFRSRCRIPVLTYLHPINHCSITRCSQPFVGMRNNRSIQDERLIEAIFSTSGPAATISYDSTQVASQGGAHSIESSHADLASLSSSGSSAYQKPAAALSADALEETLMSEVEADDIQAPRAEDSEAQVLPSFIHNESPQNLIVDARPTVNAMAMQAIGLGSENMDNYPQASKKYLGIDNIHVMRDSLAKVIEALKDSDITPLSPNRELLARSQWLRYISILLDGADLIARTVGLGHSHVVIHCSDGWDRTSQLAALSQLSLDPYFRTLEGFIVLIEKDWLSFGHQFRRRSGFLGNEKLFSIQNEGLSTAVPGSSTSSTSQPGAKALESALLSAKGFFTPSPPSATSQNPNSAPTSDTETPPHKNNPKETSPIFHQFLDAVYQLQHQHPTAFEFNERFLRRLFFHFQACQYGTFLYDSERERVEAKIYERAGCVWDYFLVRRAEWMNPRYKPPGTAEEDVADRMVFHNGTVRWWPEMFGRSDQEMNGPSIVSPLRAERQAKNWGKEDAKTSAPLDMPSTGLTSGSGRVGGGIIEGMRGIGLGAAGKGLEMQ